MKNQTHLISKDKYNDIPVSNYKKRGRVYTPTFLAVFLAKLMKKYSHSSSNVVMDPACGMGELLLAVSSVFGSALSTIVGNDINKDEISNLLEHCREIDVPQTLVFFSTDALTPFNICKTNAWIEYFDMNDIPHPNLVIANPPWGADLSIPARNRKNYTLLSNQFDSSDLFIESITNNISEGGILGIIIPDSLFFLQRATLRKYLLQKYNIKAVVRLGEKLFPKINRGAAIVVCEKKNPEKENTGHVDCFTVPANKKSQIINGEIDLYELFENQHNSVLQSHFLNNDRFQFDIQIKASENVIQKINRCESHKLEHYLEGSRGVELSKTGKIIQCPFCFNYLPLPSRNNETYCVHCRSIIPEYDLINSQRIIISTKKQETNKPIIVGENVHRYSVIQDRFIDTQYSGINYKSEKTFSGPKILIRKTGIGVSAALDYSDSLCNQVVYSYKTKDNCPYPLELFLAILNSRLAFYYFTGNSGETAWRSHPYLTQKEINCFPIPALEGISKEELLMLVSKVQEFQTAKSNSCDAWIESFVAKLYGMDRSDYNIIFNHINSAEHLQVIRDLLVITADEVSYGI